MVKITSDGNMINRNGMLLETIEDEGIYILKQINSKMIDSVDCVSLTKEPRRYGDSGQIKLIIWFSNQIKAEVIWNKYVLGGSKFLWELHIASDVNNLCSNIDDHYGCLDAVSVMDKLMMLRDLK